jgi:CRISPR-associated protein Cmr1
MKRVKFDVEFVTPCFLGGAINAQTAEWRAASIRGQLRWWFRAVAGAAEGNNLARLRSLETLSWGSTTRASRLSLVCRNVDPSAVAATGTEEFQSTAEGRGRDAVNGPAYLGYGPVGLVATDKRRRDGRSIKEFRNTRPCIRAGTRSEFSIQTKAGALGKLERLAVMAWLCFGGIGARARRGFGSLEGQSDDEGRFEPRAVASEIMEHLGISFGSLKLDSWGSYPPYSSFSAATRLLVWRAPQPTWKAAMQQIGGCMIRFRRRYEGGGRARDYVWAHKPATQQHVPDRVGFGLPLPFHRELILVGQDHGRRASPLLIHIARPADSSFLPVLLWLPAQFLPGGEEVIYTGRESKYRGSPSDPGHEAPDRVHHQIVSQFLDTLVSKNYAEEVRA